MKITYKADNPKNWIENISKQLNVPVIDGKIEIPETLGKGFIQQLTFSSDLTIYFFEIALKFPVKIIREESMNVNIFPIMFWISENDISQVTNKETKKLSLNSPYGIFFPSSHISTEMYLSANEKISNITVALSRNWFTENISNKTENNKIKELIKQNSPFFLFEDISLEMRKIIHQIISFHSFNDFSLLYLQGKIFELLSVFFKKVNNRENTITYKKINNNDITRLFEARKLLLTNFKETPKLKNIYLKTGMSESKFQSLFKQMFGMSAYQYHIVAKMEEAKKLLISNNYSVSDVGFMLGYSNLSHFTDIFKKHFNITPGKFVKQSI